ncbi:MAG: hypothetical protein WBA57_11265 [Elainellaceae cyanobacterium]
MNSDRNSQQNNTLFRKESLERLSSPEQLDQLMQIVSLKSWLPLGTLGVLVMGGLLWSIVGRIPITVTGEGLLVQSSDHGGDLVGIAYFPKAEGDRIQPGMDILLLPSGISAETGGIRGQIDSVSESDIQSVDDIRKTQSEGNSPLESRPIEAIATLMTDASTASGLEMSSPSGAGMVIPAGKTVTARVTVEEKAPIAFVFPFLDP